MRQIKIKIEADKGKEKMGCCDVFRLSWRRQRSTYRRLNNSGVKGKVNEGRGLS